MTRWIRSTDALAGFLADVASAPALALDTESNSLYRYRERVCLIQLAAGAHSALLDPLVLPDLSPLGAVLADERVVKVLHAADNDITALKRDHGVTFANVFDTMLAARFLGQTDFGLRAVLHHELGVEISKSSQKDDWAARPLSPEQEAYALADVTHLVALCERLGRRLHAAGRLGWLREEGDACAALPAAQRRADPDAYLGLKGASDLTPRQLAVLRELHAVREARAEATNTPPFRIMQPTTLIALAVASPRSSAAVTNGPEGARLARHVETLLAAIERGLAVPEAELPRRSSWRPPRPSPADKERTTAIKQVRDREAARLGLEPSFLLPQRLIDRLVATAPRTLAELAAIDGLRHWRVEAMGAALLTP